MHTPTTPNMALTNVSFLLVNAVLSLQGTHTNTATHKQQTRKHQLVDWALTGSFNTLHRDFLNKAQLTLLAKIEAHNAVLLGHGLAYDVRKPILKAFADELSKAAIQEQAA